MNEFVAPAPPGFDTPPPADAAADTPLPSNPAPPHPRPAVDPVRSAAGRLGGRRVHQLAVLGREYEKEHGLTPGRERLKQLIELGKRYEVEHGLRSPTPRRRKKGDAWQEFVAALARVVKPAHRPAVEQLAATLMTAAERPSERAA